MSGQETPDTVPVANRRREMGHLARWPIVLFALLYSVFRIRIAPKALERMHQWVRKLTARTWSIAMEERVKLLNRYLTGWGSYFGLAETPSTFGKIDSWLRRRLRQVRWTEWKRPKAQRHNLIVLGSSPLDARRWAGSGKGPWRMSGLATTLPNPE